MCQTSTSIFSTSVREKAGLNVLHLPRAARSRGVRWESAMGTGQVEHPMTSWELNGFAGAGSAVSMIVSSATVHFYSRVSGLVHPMDLVLD
jgi:hypothetical protein